MSFRQDGESEKKIVKSIFVKMGSRQWVLLLLLGLLLTVIVLPVTDKKTETDEKKQEQTLEEKLENLLSQVEGVGKVRVVLMTGEEKDSTSFYNSKQEKVTGVLIAAQGADNPVVSRNIAEGVMALFQIEAHKIKIVKMK